MVLGGVGDFGCWNLLFGRYGSLSVGLDLVLECRENMNFLSITNLVGVKARGLAEAGLE